MPKHRHHHHYQTSEQKKEDWMNSKWRPMMGWMYMAICLFDFMIAPVLWSLVQAKFHGGITTQWQPLTLQGAGLFHVAMGAVLGVTAYGRTQEKLNGANNGGLQGFGPGAGTTYIPPGQGQAIVSNQPMMGGMNQNNGFNSGFNSPSNSGFNSPSNSGFNSPGNSGFGSPSNSGFGSPSNSGFGSPSNSGFNNNAPQLTPQTTASTTPATNGFNVPPPSVNSKGQKVVPQDDHPPI
jgi:Holin of 3TMs, for gene-transfer release